MTKFSIEESTVYQYIILPVSCNYTVTAYDIIDGTIITNPSVNPQVLKYVKLPFPTQTVIPTSKYYLINYVLLYDILLGRTSSGITTSSCMTVDITDTTYVTVTSTLSSSTVSKTISILAACSGLLVLIVVVMS